MHDAHTPTAAASRRLDNHGVTNIAGKPEILVSVFAERTVRARHAGYAGFLHCADSRYLVAHQANSTGRRPDEDEAGHFATLGKIRILRQEAVAGVDGHSVCHFGRRDDRGHVEIAVSRGRWTNADGFVGEEHVLQIVFRRRMHGDCLDAHLATGAKNTQRYLATIGNNDFIQHAGRPSRLRAGRSQPGSGRIRPARHFERGST